MGKRLEILAGITILNILNEGDKLKKIVGIILIIVIAGWGLYSANNFDRIVLGTDNYGTDPNPTADITFQNDEYISNLSNGVLDFGSAFIKLGSLSAGIDSFQTVSGANYFHDTVTVAGAASSDVVLVTIVDVSPVAGDLLSVQTGTNKFIVHRIDTTTANLHYDWQLIKK